MLRDLLRALSALPSSERRDDYLLFVRSRGEAALWKGEGQEHVTASCFIFSPDADQTLLCFHRKGGFWVQLGGHLEQEDAGIAAAALREAHEESGLADLRLVSEGIVDLDRHELAGGFTCAAHWDIGFTAIADPTAPIVVSEESRDVRWFPVDALPAGLAPGAGLRIERAHRLLDPPAPRDSPASPGMPRSPGALPRPGSPPPLASPEALPRPGSLPPPRSGTATA